MPTSFVRRAVKASAAAADRIRPPRRGVVVLLYHRVGAGSRLQVDLPSDLFDEQMAELAAAARTLRLDDALTLLQDPTPPASDPVVVTFDDGTADFVEIALPILERHRVPAVLYVATDFVERGRDFPDQGTPASWASLRDALSTGLVTIGSHTDTHALLDRVPVSNAEQELDRSRELIGERLGVAAEHFAYPKAVMGSAGADAAVRARFRSAAVAGTRPNPYGRADPYRLTRSPIQVADGLRWFRRKAAGGMALEGSLRRVLDHRRYAGSNGMTPAAPSRPRLVHVTTTDMSLALLLGPQLQAFAEAGYEVIGASAPGHYVAELERSGIRHLPLRHATRSHAPHRDVRAILELRSLFRELRPDIVHTHNPKPGVYGRLAGRWARVPAVVNTVHGLYALPSDRWSKRALVYGLERIAAKRSDAELVQNPEDMAVLEGLGIPGDKLTLLGNGIDLRRFDPGRVDPARVVALRRELGAGPDDVVCAAVGRLVWEKGYRELLDAAAQLHQRAPAVRFVVVGPPDPAKRDSITDADVRAAEATSNIRFLGERDDVDALYAAMDLYVLASHREGWPRSAMEAAAMGVPVIATDVRGCRQVVDDGITGVLVPVRDAGALASTIESLAADREIRQRMGTAARDKARRDFDQQHVIDITLDVYERLLRSRPRVEAAR